MCLLCCVYPCFLCTTEKDVSDEPRGDTWFRFCGSKSSKINTGDKKCRMFVEKVKAKGVTTYEKYAYGRKCSPNLPLLHNNRGNSSPRKTRYLSISRPSVSLSDVTERTEDSLSISFSYSYDTNNSSIKPYQDYSFDDAPITHIKQMYNKDQNYDTYTRVILPDNV